MGTERLIQGQNRLVGLTGMEIAVDVETADRPFDRIDCAVGVAVQFLEVLVQQFGNLGIGPAGHPVVAARLVA
jgi:hypothetical protein